MGKIISDMYIIKTCVFSPRNLGIPARRLRRYTLLFRKDLIIVGFDWARETLEDIFWRRVELSARVFFRAPGSYLKKVYTKIAQSRGMPSDSDVLHLLAPGGRSRLADHIELAKQKGVDFAVMNISQNASYYGQASLGFCEMPPLTTASSQVWGRDMTNKTSFIDRFLTGYEKLGVHGWPVLLPKQDPLSSHLPQCLSFEKVFSSQCSLSESDLGLFAGNGMHVAAVGLALTAAILAVQPPGLKAPH
jgi:hypothetical protein